MKRKKILLLLAEGFEFFEASVFIDVIGWNLVVGDGSTELFSCGLRKELNSSFNQNFKVDFLCDEINIDLYDAIAIPGGFEEFGFYKDAYNNNFLNLIKEFKNKNKIIASICVGSLPLAKSGILKGKNGTTYLKNPVRVATLKEHGVNVIENPIILDDNIITSWNPSTAINVALLLLELLTSKDNSDKIRNMMGFQ